MTANAIDLVCWDFGDTLVQERLMRRSPPGVPEWEEVYDRVIDVHPEWEADWMLGRAAMIDLVPWLAAELPMTHTAIARYLRTVWQEIEWFSSAREWVERLNGCVTQAVVTVNPTEFSGIATACGLDPLVDIIVTSADIASLNKVAMSEHARRLLGLDAGVATSLLIDNRHDNIDEFTAAGGRGYHFTPDGFARDAEDLLGSLC
jgi:FMN phosphatase YigB (HAD superfamily)